MSFFVQLLEAITVLVPDVLTMGLLAPAFFSLYCAVKALGLTGAADMDSALRVSLTLAYLATLAVNIFGAVQFPARSGKLETQPVEHRGAVIES